MKITRFVNGQIFEHSLKERGILVKNEVISGTIEVVKRRISVSSNRDESVNE